MPAATESPQTLHSEFRVLNTGDGYDDVRPSWRSLFVFVTRKQISSILIPLVSTSISALIKPASAIFFGKIFTNLTQFGAGVLGSQDTLDNITLWVIALVCLAAVAWVIEAIFLSSWMIFGEIQAKKAREQLFIGMLDKEMQWYDLRQDGIGSLLIRIQTSVIFLFSS